MVQRCERAHLCWSPEWEGAIKSWAINFTNRNKWRCDGIHDFDDLLQDAYLTFLKIADRYPRVIEARHFMALFKRAMQNQMHDRARYVSKKRVLHEETSTDAAELSMERIGEVTNYGYLQAVLAEAPEELQMALAVFQNNPESLRDVTGLRENLNMKLHRILGIGGDFDFAGGLRTLLTGRRPPRLHPQAEFPKGSAG